MNLDHITDDIRHVAEILRADNDAATKRRFDLFQADAEALMREDEHETIKRIVAARNTVLRERARD